MRKKTWTSKIALLLTALLIFTALAGCGGGTSTTGGSNEDAQSTDPGTENASKDSTSGGTSDETGAAGNTAAELDPVTLTLWSCGDKYSDQDSVLEAFCEKYKDVLNIDKIEFNFVSFGDYEDKMTSLVAGGDNFDGFYVSDWMLYSKMANKGAFLELNDLITSYAPSLYSTYETMGVIQACSIDGQLVALPWTTEKSSKAVLYWRQDLADEYGVDTSDITTIEDVDRLFAEAKEKIPNITIFESGFPRGNTYSDVLAMLHSKYELDAMNYHMFTFDLNADTVTLEPVEQTEMFKEAVTWMYKWYEEGIVSKNELSETDTQLFQNGKTFARVGLMESALSDVGFNVAEAKLGYAEIYPDGKFRYDSPLNNAFAINKSAANPERLLMLLELLNTDEEAYDLFMYGLEGQSYVVDDDGVIAYPEGQDASNSSYLDWFKWPFVREHFEKPSGTKTADYMTNINEWLGRDSLVVSPLVGFNPDTSEIKTELAARDQLYDEQGKLLLAGIIEGGDVEAAIDKYIENQKNAGLSQIQDFMQKYGDEMLGN